MKTKIEKKLKRKTNNELVETIIKTKKGDKWLEISDKISRPRRTNISLNLRDINEQAKDGDRIIIPGKVLSSGEIDKKVSISALKFSNSAKEKLKKAGIKISTILEEVKSNPKGENIKILDKRVKRN